MNEQPEQGNSQAMDYVYSEDLDLNRFVGGRTGNTAGLDTESEPYQVQTKTLYGIAKGFLEEMKQLGQKI